MNVARPVVALLLLVVAAHAQAKTKSKLGLSVEPVVGYEREVKVFPSVHNVERFFYGGRLIAGYPLLSAEVEYTRAQDTEDFPSQSLTVKDKTDKLKVGARSTPNIGKILYISFRAGMQAERTTRETVTSGVSTTSEQAIEYDPYAGLGFRLDLGKKMTLAFDVTGVITDTSNLSNFEPQASAGISIKFP